MNIGEEMKKYLVAHIFIGIGILCGACVIPSRQIPDRYYYHQEPDCSAAHLEVGVPPVESLDECWDNCCMYSHENCQETYCYWVGDYNCYWEKVEIYCW